jgi:hypothetical protein
LNIVPEFIKAPFKAALGIASPSKVFTEYGMFIGAGLIDGVDVMRRPVRSAISLLVSVPNLPTHSSSSLSTSHTQMSGGGSSVLSPKQLIVVDANGELIGRMRVEAESIIRRDRRIRGLELLNGIQT